MAGTMTCPNCAKLEAILKRLRAENQQLKLKKKEQNKFKAENYGLKRRPKIAPPLEEE
jgi:hypothetical protein